MPELVKVGSEHGARRGRCGSIHKKRVCGGAMIIQGVPARGSSHGTNPVAGSVRPGTARATRVLGIDPGTRVAGYAVLDVPRSGDPVYVECGLLRAKTSDSVAERLLEIATGLEELIGEFRPTVMALEQAFYGKNLQSALRLGEARGALTLVGMRAGLQLREYAPAHIKRAVTGSGRATKIEIQQRVRMLCRLQHEPDSDAADALAIALCYARHAMPGLVPMTAGVGGVEP